MIETQNSHDSSFVDRVQENLKAPNLPLASASANSKKTFRNSVDFLLIPALYYQSAGEGNGDAKADSASTVRTEPLKTE